MEAVAGKAEAWETGAELESVMAAEELAMEEAEVSVMEQAEVSAKALVLRIEFFDR